MQQASAYQREMFAITQAITKWRQYLLGYKFQVITDQQSLRNFRDQVIQTPDQHKWLGKLLRYDFDIIYRPGKHNEAADAISQVRDDPALLPAYTIKEGLLFFQNILVIPANSPINQKLLQEFHASPIGGHSGITCTFHRLAANFYWPNMRKDAHTFVTNCHTCQQMKTSCISPSGLLQPLPIPQQVFESIAMDFITSPLLCHGKMVIMVVVDRLSKYGHFIALPTAFTSSSIATVFVIDIIRLHGVPLDIISD